MSNKNSFIVIVIVIESKSLKRDVLTLQSVNFSVKIVLITFLQFIALQSSLSYPT